MKICEPPFPENCWWYILKCISFNDWSKRWGKTACRYNSQVWVPAPTRVWELCVSTLTCWENGNINSVRRGECSTHITPGTLRDYEISSFDLNTKWRSNIPTQRTRTVVRMLLTPHQITKKASKISKYASEKLDYPKWSVFQQYHRMNLRKVWSPS